MAQSIIAFCNKSILYLFYSLFFLVPAVFVNDTYELFEFNKMWVTFAITILLVLFWTIKAFAARRFVVQRTLLDIPILLFLLSQFIATIHSLDTHSSVWGYYSRFNGGLLSMVCYVLLYYVFASNLNRIHVKKIINVSLITGLVVSLWGLPSHFSHDPTCLLFRGTFDISCWTSAFAPNVRMFSSLGQPDWFAAYLAVLLPLSLAKLFGLFQQSSKNKTLRITYYSLLSALFYIDLIWTDSKGGFLGVWAAIILFLGFVWFGKKMHFVQNPAGSLKKILIVILGFIVISFIIGIPAVGKLKAYTLPEIQLKLAANHATSTQTPALQKTPPQQAATTAAPLGEFGSTDSGQIRLYVWKGALDIWKANPLFGTGVETFAFAYYLQRPIGHNLTTEWDFLYNKAHNEYLNYLATTGAFGLGTYLLITGCFFFIFAKRFPFLFSKVNQQSKDEKSKDFLLISALLASYISILVTNFFGFSVVILNIYLFLIPAFALFLVSLIDQENVFAFGNGLTKITTNFKKQPAGKIIITNVSPLQWFLITMPCIIALILLVQLFRFWQADKAYALGYNLDHAAPSNPQNQQFQIYEQAYQKLHEAVSIRNDEPTFLDELTINDAIIASALANAKQINQAQSIAAEAIAISDKIVSEHPNNVVFWKTRVRVFYTLAQVQPQYLVQALDAVRHAQALAPTDAKISYNLGLLYGQTGDINTAINTLEESIKLKPNYGDAYYALGLFYHERAVDKSGKIIDRAAQQKAVDTLRFLLKDVQPNYLEAQKALKSWGGQ